MTLLKCLYHDKFTRKVVESSENSNKEYQIIWLAEVNDPDLSGTQVLALARAATPGARFDHVPVANEEYSFLGFTDSGSTAKSITCELEDPDCRTVWIITADYKPSSEGKLQFLGPEPPSHPLRWPVTSWMEVMDEQGVVEKIWSFSNLPSLTRSVNSGKEPGIICNAAGQQTIDPLTEIKYRYILNVLVFYPNELYAIALNSQFGRTVHCHTHFNTDVPGTGGTPGSTSGYPDLLFGCPYYTWKFLAAIPDKPKWRQVKPKTGEEETVGEDIETHEGAIKYVPTTIKIEFFEGDLISDVDLGIGTGPSTAYTFRSGWLKKILNNGQTCFRKWQSKVSAITSEVFIEDPRFKPAETRKMLLPTTCFKVKDDFDLSFVDPRPPSGTDRPQPKSTDMQEVQTSEPVNLKLDGTQITDPEAKATYIYGLDLAPSDYFNITDYFGNPLFTSELELPTFPLTYSP